MFSRHTTNKEIYSKRSKLHNFLKDFLRKHTPGLCIKSGCTLKHIVQLQYDYSI